MADRRLLLATSNQHKIQEMRALLGDIPFAIVSPRDLGLELDVPEPFDTYLANATQKARAYAAASGMLALADDSGLEIDVLGGEPGVFSARFGGEQMSYPERFALIERRLAGVLPERRTARFRCVLVLAAPPPDDRLAHVEGVVEGQIAPVPRGAQGFGYDPIFWLPERGMTMAELTPAEKDAISHRGRAARAMAEVLRAWPQDS
jgi:XTP/dITP diphosphohydrolase